MKSHAPGSYARAARLAAAALVCLSAHSAAQAAEPDQQSCVQIDNDSARLACYDRHAGRTPTAKAKPSAGPTLPARQVTAAQFGSEKMGFDKKDASAPKAINTITGTVQSVSFNPWKKFTLTLTNGQVWKQDSGDTSGRPAYFPQKDDVKVTISRGLFDSYNLTIAGSALIYKVHRVK